MDSRKIIAALEVGANLPSGKRIHGEYFCLNFIGMSQMFQYNGIDRNWVTIGPKHKKGNFDTLTFLRQS